MSATISVQGSDADKGGDLLTVEGTEFGKGAYEGEGGHGAYTGDIHEEVELALPEGVGVNEVVNLLVQVIEFLGEEVDVFVEAGKKRIEGTIEAQGLGGSHVDELLSAGEEGLEMGSLRVWEGAGVGSEGEGEAGAMEWASMASVLASLPMERAKSLIRLGFITAVGIL